jgi:ankyrin repeat protein
VTSASVIELLDAHPDLVNAKNENGVSAVLLATYFGHREIAKSCLPEARS